MYENNHSIILGDDASPRSYNYKCRGKWTLTIKTDGTFLKGPTKSVLILLQYLSV